MDKKINAQRSPEIKCHCFHHSAIKRWHFELKLEKIIIKTLFIVFIEMVESRFMCHKRPSRLDHRDKNASAHALKHPSEEKKKTKKNLLKFDRWYKSKCTVMLTLSAHFTEIISPNLYAIEINNTPLSPHETGKTVVSNGNPNVPSLSQMDLLKCEIKTRGNWKLWNLMSCCWLYPGAKVSQSKYE